MCKERLFSTVGWGKVYNNLGHSLSLFRDELNRNRCFVNSGEVLVYNSVQNGWVYSTTSTILADITEPVMQTIQKLGCHTFLYHLINTGHFFKLTSLLSDNTVFLPTDEAFEKMSVKVKRRLKDDPKYLLALVMYHLTNTRYLSSSLNETKEILTSTWDGMEQGPRRLFVTSNGNGTVQHASVINPDVLALNGVVHVLNQVLVPPTQTLYEHISGKKRFKLLLKILHTTNSPLLRILKDKDAHVTLLAPTNRPLKTFLRFYNATEDNFKTNKNAKRKLRHALLRHVLVEPYFVTSAKPDLGKELQTYNKEMIYKKRVKLRKTDEDSNGQKYDKYRVVPLVQRVPNVVQGQKLNNLRINRLVKKDRFLEDVNQRNSIDFQTLRLCSSNKDPSSNQVLVVNTKNCFNITQLNSTTTFIRPERLKSVNDSSLNNYEQQRVQLQKNMEKMRDLKSDILPKSFIKVGDFYDSLTRRNIPAFNGVIHVVKKVLCLDCSMNVRTKNSKRKRKKKINI